ncbi:MAG: ABC transporter permease [Bacilli bacterium]|jgi:sodium transport system permease protein
MKNIKSIIKKDLDKIFKFPRSLISTLILPGFIIFIIYFMMGQSFDATKQKAIEHESKVYVINVAESFEGAAELAKELKDFGKISFFEEKAENLEDLKAKILEGEIEAVVVFDEGFDAKIAQNEKPNVIVYFDESNINSGIASGKIQTILEIQKNNYLIEKEIDPIIFSVDMEEITPEEKVVGTMLAMVLPVLILSFIFSSAIGLSSDAIAGEKERGTLPKLLVLPIPRNQIIIGKIISTTLLTILSACSSFIGVVAALPFIKNLLEVPGGISYGAVDFLLLLGVLIMLATLASSLLLVTSTIAKTIKEATAYAMPVFLAVMILPMMTMFSGASKTGQHMYLIPIYNFVMIIKDLLSSDFNVINYLLVIGSSLVTIVLLIFILIKLFKSEKVLFAQ